MGRRRIRLMQAMPDGFEIVGVNRSAERRAQVEKKLGIRASATSASGRLRELREDAFPLAFAARFR